VFDLRNAQRSLRTSASAALTSGGISDERNLLLLCRNCSQSFSTGRPHESEFVFYLATLIKSTSGFDSLQINPIVGTTPRLRADLIVYRSSGATREQLLIECKNLPAFSSEQLHSAIEQLRRYGEAAKPDRLILAFPGRVHAADKTLLAEAQVDVWDLDEIAARFSEAISENPHPYFQPLFQAVLGKLGVQKEQQLIAQLKSCQPGKDQWPVYQKLVGEILEHLFCPPLRTPISQSADAVDVNRRDFILGNSADAGFWRFMRDTYDAHFVVVDAKNSANETTKDDALQINNYLKEFGAGLFGLIVCRKGADAGCIHTLREQSAHSRKMVLVINDEDLATMLLARSAGGSAEELLNLKLQEFRLAM